MIYAISDLHLSMDGKKPMQRFGGEWLGHPQSLFEAWRSLVKPEDTVIVPGDISWALRLEEAIPDLAAVQELPGNKLLFRGNHDLWWGSLKKLNALGFRTLRFMQNDAVSCEGLIICGTRGWSLDTTPLTTISEVTTEAQNRRLYERELCRLRLTLDSAQLLRRNVGGEILVCFHYPPYDALDGVYRFGDMLREYGVHRVLFGHIHNVQPEPAPAAFDGIDCRCVSADLLGMVPVCINRG